MWKCKKCGGDSFYQPFSRILVITKVDKNQNIIESEEGTFAEYGRFYCPDCGKAGWTLDEVAKWVEDE